MSNMEINYNLNKSKRRESLSNKRRKSIVSVDDLPLNYKSKRKSDYGLEPKPSRKSSIKASSSVTPATDARKPHDQPHTSHEPQKPPHHEPVAATPSHPTSENSLHVPSSLFASLTASSFPSTSHSSSSQPSTSTASSLTTTVPKVAPAAIPSSSSSASSSSNSSAPLVSDSATSMSKQPPTHVPSSSTHKAPTQPTTSEPSTRPIPAATSTAHQSKKSRKVPPSPIPEPENEESDVSVVTAIVRAALKEISTDDPLFLEYKKMGQVFISHAVASEFAPIKPNEREVLEAKHKQIEESTDKWSREEQSWDLLLAKHKQQQETYKQIYAPPNTTPKNKKNKEGDNNVLAQLQRYVVELEHLKPRLSEVENYIEAVQTKLTKVASDIQHSALPSNETPQEIIRKLTSN